MSAQANEYKYKLINLPMSLWKCLDDEAKAEKRSGRSKQLEMILEDRYKDNPCKSGGDAPFKRIRK